MSRRERKRLHAPPSRFFRGKELLVLLLFVGIAVVGWPIVINQMRRSTNDTNSPPRATTRKPDPRPIEPLTGEAFEAIRDKVPNSFRELTAYAEVLERVRSRTPDQLRAEARRDLLFTHLWERPAAYRGVPVHVEGTLLRSLDYEAAERLTPRKRLQEAWFVTEESRPFPYVVVFEEPPAGFTLGDRLNQPIVVDGYFFKLMGYRAGDVPRAAPMLIGRITLPGASGTAASGASNSADPVSKPSLLSNPAAWAVGTLALYAAIRLALRAASMFRSTRIGSAHRERADDGSQTLPPSAGSPTEADVSAFLSELERGE